MSDQANKNVNSIMSSARPATGKVPFPVHTLASAATGKVGVAVVPVLAPAHVASSVVVADVVAGAVAAAARTPFRVNGA